MRKIIEGSLEKATVYGENVLPLSTYNRAQEKITGKSNLLIAPFVFGEFLNNH